MRSAEDFDIGDKVRILNERTGYPSGWVGTVVDIDEPADTVAVDAPFTEVLRYRAEILVPENEGEVFRDDAEQAQYKDDFEDTDIEGRVASRHETLLNDLRRATSDCKSQGLKEVQAYRVLNKHYGRWYSDHEIRRCVESQYGSLEDRVAKDLSKLAVRDSRIEEPAINLLSSL